MRGHRQVDTSSRQSSRGVSLSANRPTLGQICAELVDIARQMKADGASEAERQAYIERGIRSAWPQVRVWKYLCDDCSDSGWQHQRCTPRQPCGRSFTLPGQHSDDYTGRGRCSPGHDYARPCHCLKGRQRYSDLHRMRAQDDVTQVGRGASKPPSRFGR